MQRIGTREEEPMWLTPHLRDSQPEGEHFYRQNTFADSNKECISYAQNSQTQCIKTLAATTKFAESRINQ